MGTGSAGPGLSVAAPLNVVSDVTLQQQFEQLGAAIAEGHGILNRIQGQDGDAQTEPVSAGAMATSQRCQSEMQDLIRRLNEVASAVGQI